MPSFWSRIRAWLGRARIDREMRDEMRQHIDLEAAELARVRGLPPDEARRQALVRFGGVGRYEEEHRDARGTRWLDDLARDLRYAARSLARSPAFTISAAAVLALGIGSTTAIFSAVDAVIIARLPFPHDEQLVRIFEQNSPTNRWNISNADFLGVAAEQRSFSDVGAIRYGGVAISMGGDPRRAVIAQATSGLFRALGVRPEYGRLLEARDDVQGAPRVVVVTHEFAERELGGAANAVGRSMTIDGTSSTVVGVLPPGCRELVGARSDLWPSLQIETPTRRGPFPNGMIARLKPGVTLEAARADLRAISRRLTARWSADLPDTLARLTPYTLRSQILRDAPRTLSIFSAAVLLVLLIAVANVASLMLVRVAGRTRELTLRAVLGASRGRIARLLVTESVSLGALGAALGIACAWLVLKALDWIGPAIPRLAGLTLDARAVAFAAFVGVASGALIAIQPVAALLRGSPASALRSGDREVGAGRGTHALRGVLVSTQFALALPLLAGAGLLLNSFLRLQRVDAGFDAAPLLYVHVSLPRGAYRDNAAMVAFWTRAVARVRETPGIVDAGVSGEMPGEANGDFDDFDLLDRPVLAGTSEPVTIAASADAGFFATTHVPLLEGRLFTEGDSANAPPVVLVSRSWVRRFSSDRPALGRQLYQGGCRTCPPTTVVGIVGDVRFQGLAGEGDAMYNPTGQSLMRDANLFARTPDDPARAVERVRAALRSLDPALALDDAGPLDARVRRTLAPQRHLATMLGGFAIAAVALAAVGIFGMLSYLVEARRREIGVRVALGARRPEVIAMVLRRGMTFALPGAALGLIAALVSGRWLSGVLYDVGAADPATLVGVTLLLLCVALIACWLPARRAAGVAPMVALRDE